MSTNSYSAIITHANDANFRTWVAAYIAGLLAAGTASGLLTQTTDTGQINTGTVTRPGTNTAAGYAIFNFTDATGTIYIKLEFGTASSALVPSIWMTAGTGTNGAGTLTGSTSTRVQCSYSAAPSAVAATNAYVCVTTASVGFAWAVIGITGFSFWGLERHVDASDAVQSSAFSVYAYVSGQTKTQSVNISTGTKYPSASQSASYCVVPNDLSASLLSGGNYQLFKHFSCAPDTYSLRGVATVVGAELAFGTTDTATLNGATSRTYLSLAGSMTNAANGGTSGYNLAMLYE